MPPTFGYEALISVQIVGDRLKVARKYCSGLGQASGGKENICKKKRSADSPHQDENLRNISPRFRIRSCDLTITKLTLNLHSPIHTRVLI